MEKTKKELLEIWNKPYMDNIPTIKDRGFMFCENESQKDILIIGINPSCRKDEEHLMECSFDFEASMNIEKYDAYFSPIKKMIYNNGDKDLRDKCSYLDIFYFRATNQEILKQEILKGDLSFIYDQLVLSQNTIENIIKPKLIMIKNKEASAYFGILAEKGLIWMGYDCEPIKEVTNGEHKVGDLYRIKGLLPSSERINQEAIQTSNLNGCLVLVTPHINQYLKKEKRPTPELIEGLLNLI